MVFCRIRVSFKKLAVFIAVALLYLLLIYLKVPCIFKHFFGVPCPGCGMSRALFELLSGNPKAAFCWHPMVYFMPLAVFVVWQNGRVFCQKKYNVALCVAIAIGFLLCYSARFLGYLNQV